MARRRNVLLNIVGNILLDYFNAQPNPNQEEEGVPEIGELSVIQSLKKKDGAVISIIGAPTMGKTVCSHRLAEIIGRPTYTISQAEKPPPWIQPLALEQLDTLPPKYSTLILDDILTFMSSRDYNDPFVQALERIAPTARHERKIILIFNTQVASLTDKYALTGELVILKAPSVLYADLERPMVKKLQDGAYEYWEGKSEKWLQKHAFIISHFWKGLVRINLPSVPQTSTNSSGFS